MSRPPSIILFERLYLGSIALYILNAALFWTQNRALVAAMPQLRANAQLASLVGAIIVGSLVVTLLLSLLFWWLVAKQRSEAGKWAVVVTEVIGALLAVLPLIRLVQGATPNVVGAVLGLASTALAIWAATLLFRPDAQPWFGEQDAAEPLA